MLWLRIMMNKILVFSLALVLTGCATKFRTEAGSVIDFATMTAKAPVVATIKGDVFTGWALGRRDGTGTIEMKSVIYDIDCVGEFRYISRSAEAASGVGSITCNNGATSDFNFTGIDALSGYGYGASNVGPVTFTFGLKPEQSSKYLQKPFEEIEKVTKELIEGDIS